MSDFFGFVSVASIIVSAIIFPISSSFHSFGDEPISMNRLGVSM